MEDLLFSTIKKVNIKVGEFVKVTTFEKQLFGFVSKIEKDHFFLKLKDKQEELKLSFRLNQITKLN